MSLSCTDSRNQVCKAFPDADFCLADCNALSGQPLIDVFAKLDLLFSYCIPALPKDDTKDSVNHRKRVRCKRVLIPVISCVLNGLENERNHLAVVIPHKLNILSMANLRGKICLHVDGIVRCFGSSCNMVDQESSFKGKIIFGS